MTDPAPENGARGGYDHDVVIVGGGPAGCSAGVFTAREGLDTLIFDRGRSSIGRCAHLENYLGFPDGIDIETLYDLMHEHAETAGCEIVPDVVESVDQDWVGGGFVVERGEGERITARRVVAATRYDGSYMRGLDDDAAMFETYEHDGEEHERFDRGYADHDGRTPVDGLYVVSPSEEADTQAIVAAGRGARVARRVIADARIDDGWWEEAARVFDWTRREAERDDRWADREAWVEAFEDRHAEAAPVDPDSERFRRVSEAAVDDSLSSYVSREEVEARAEAAHETLAAHLDVEAIVRAVDGTALLDAVDDDLIREHVDGEGTVPEVSD